MVATILKKVTEKGIEAATQSISPIQPEAASSTPATTNSTSILGTASASNLNLKQGSIADNDAKDPTLPSGSINVDVNNVKISDKKSSNGNDGYFGNWSSSSYVTSVSEYYSSARNAFNTASDEASKQISNLTPSSWSILQNNFTTKNPIEGENGSTLEIPTQQSEENTTSAVRAALSKSTTSRKWFRNIKDPYNNVTGTRNSLLNTNHEDSVIALKNLLEFVDVDQSNNQIGPIVDIAPTSSGNIKYSSEALINSRISLSEDDSHDEISTSSQPQMMPNIVGTPGYGKPNNRRQPKISNEVKASMLGDLTIRAMRDMALSEALELHDALRFWTERLERPFLHYLEFGPKILLTREDPSNVIGQNVSQLQAVLARRCSCIGELQQHLWRAGWQSGVGQWGIVGQGEWAAVVGGHGAIDDNTNNINNQQVSSSDEKKRLFSSIRENMTQTIGGGDKQKKKSDYYAKSHLFVSNVRGGKIITNDPALASWSIDAIRVVRDQLYSAGNTSKPLPFYENWPSEERFFRKNEEIEESRLGDSMISIDDNAAFFNDESPLDLPLWATHDFDDDSLNMLRRVRSGTTSLGATNMDEDITNEDGIEITPSLPSLHNGDILIGDIGLMAAEVKTILSSMEKYMKLQRERRLQKLRPPSRLIRNWYIVALTAPAIGYVGYRLFQGKAYVPLANEVYHKIASFWAEHVSEPLQSIYRELFTKRGREDVTDRKARQVAIQVLQRMIKSWLEEVYPKMPEAERNERASNMDLSLIEAAKEYSVKNILEINNIYRLSLIEMQFIKKEMMNALYQMDVLMGSNEINMKLAAMTPFFILASTARYIIHKIMYAILKIGKSREETYSSFRHILLDIERLLVMRDNPPPLAPPLSTSINNKFKASVGNDSEEKNEVQNHREQVLNSNDLGMLMLLVYECRVILWQDRRRFTRTELRNVSEDLAELAGERGAVSVQQQLRIIARMCRTYSFLKVISSGISFSTNA